MKKIINKVINELKNEKEIQIQLKSKNALKHYYRQVKLIKNYTNPKKILDIGCGHGIPTIFIRNEFNNSKINAIELRTSPVWKRIKKQYQINFEKFNGKQIPFKNNFFDAIVMFGVLEHVTENNTITESEFLKEINRVLKKRGYLFIFNLPNTYSYKEIITSFTPFWYHKRRFRKKEIRQILNKWKFNVKYLRGFGVIPAGCGPLYPISSILNVFSFITDLEEKLPEFPLCEYFDIVAQKV